MKEISIPAQLRRFLTVSTLLTLVGYAGLASYAATQLKSCGGGDGGSRSTPLSADDERATEGAEQFHGMLTAQKIQEEIQATKDYEMQQTPQFMYGTPQAIASITPPPLEIAMNSNVLKEPTAAATGYLEALSRAKVQDTARPANLAGTRTPTPTPITTPMP